jgi:hypothetical protein
MVFGFVRDVVMSWAGGAGVCPVLRSSLRGVGRCGWMWVGVACAQVCVRVCVCGGGGGSDSDGKIYQVWSKCGGRCTVGTAFSTSTL